MHLHWNTPLLSKLGNADSEQKRDIFLSPLPTQRVNRCVRNMKTLKRRTAVLKILVDFCFETSLAVTLVLQLLEIDHHFFLDFIFQ